MVVKGVINIVSHLIGLDKRDISTQHKQKQHKQHKQQNQQNQQNQPITITILNYKYIETKVKLYNFHLIFT